MPMLRPKPRSGSSWLPSQVVYGMDTSDSDPSNWTPFGDEHDKAEAKKVQSASAPAVKGDQPKLSSQASP